MMYLSSYLHRHAVSKLPNDGLPIIISFPKAGRTWLRVMLDEMGIKAHYDHDRTGHNKKVHWKTLRASKQPYSKRKVVFLARDPRDTVVSGFFQATLRLQNFEGDISQFIRDPQHGILKICTFYAHWEKAGGTLPQFLLVKYEDIHADALNTLVSLSRFVTGQSPSSEMLDKAIAAGQFDVMREREKSGYYAETYGGKLTVSGESSQHPEAYKTRKGKVGGYVDYLSTQDIEYCAEIMKGAGYPFGYGNSKGD